MTAKFDYTQLRKRFHKVGATQRLISDKIGLSEAHFSRKLSGQYSFTQEEILSLCEILHIPRDEIGKYFYTPDEEEDFAPVRVRKNNMMTRRIWA